MSVILSTTTRNNKKQQETTRNHTKQQETTRNNKKQQQETTQNNKRFFGSFPFNPPKKIDGPPPHSPINHPVTLARKNRSDHVSVLSLSIHVKNVVFPG